MSLTGKLFLHSDETLGGIGGGLLTNIICLILNSSRLPPNKLQWWMRVRGKGESSSILGLERSVIIYLCFSLAVPSVPDGAGGRVGGRRPSGECRSHCLASTSSPIHIHYPIQVGTNTPTITGYFEVEVGGQVVHSKKVT